MIEINAENARKIADKANKSMVENQPSNDEYFKQVQGAIDMLFKKIIKGGIEDSILTAASRGKYSTVIFQFTAKTWFKDFPILFLMYGPVSDNLKWFEKNNITSLQNKLSEYIKDKFGMKVHYVKQKYPDNIIIVDWSEEKDSETEKTVKDKNHHKDKNTDPLHLHFF